jgi:hypothetical protein
MMPDLTGMDVFERGGAEAARPARPLRLHHGGAVTERARTFIEGCRSRGSTSRFGWSRCFDRNFDRVATERMLRPLLCRLG